MMRAVMISIQPKWCELIAGGKKTVEVRKTTPKLEPPFKCYIYCTQDKRMITFFKPGEEWYGFKTEKFTPIRRSSPWSGKVIGEFVCDGIEEFTPTEKGVAFRRFRALHDSCLSVAEIRAYLGGKVGYGWHISNLVIYDNPKALSEFVLANTQHYCHLQRPPQSWCYVEEV